jgi:hypothetical protein
VGTVAQAALLLPHGTWTVERPRTPTWAEFAAADHLPLHPTPPLRTDSHLLLEEGLGTATTTYTRFIKAAGPAANCVLPLHVEGGPEAVVAPFYLSRIACAGDPDELWREIRSSCAEGPRTFVVGRNCAGADDRLTAEELAALNRTLRLSALTPNLVAFEADSPEDAVLVTPFPWVPGWRTRIDQTDTAPIEVNGAFVAAPFPAGRHKVEVAYVSRHLGLGYAVFGATLLALVAAGAASFASRLRRAPLLLGVLAFVAALGASVRSDPFHVERRMLRERTLNNTYPELLREQLARWGRPD